MTMPTSSHRRRFPARRPYQHRHGNIAAAVLVFAAVLDWGDAPWRLGRLLPSVAAAEETEIKTGDDGCSVDRPCADGESFCDSGECLECPWHVHECFLAEERDGRDKPEGGKSVVTKNLSEEGRLSCADTCNLDCWQDAEGSVAAAGGEVQLTATWSPWGSKNNNWTMAPFRNSPEGDAEGILIDCKTGYEGECVLPEEGGDGAGYVCLIKFGYPDIWFGEQIDNCEAAGGVAAIIYHKVHHLLRVDLRDWVTNIPSVGISLSDGERLLRDGLGKMARVTLSHVGESCRSHCSIHHPCTAPGQFCNYDKGEFGYCQDCFEESKWCFFAGLPLAGAQHCSEVCGASLIFPECKFCGNGISGKSIETADVEGGEPVCEFCPGGLKEEYADVKMELFGKSMDCFNMDEFFRNYAIAEDDPNCKLSRMFNFICGCEGTGYAGASSEAKRDALVWVPRVSGIVSFLGSLAIIVDILRNKKKREKIQNQLLVGLSVFDLMGSVAYAFTTLPIPEGDWHISGSKGNDATCKAQGFFIQIGTVASFINVSLAVYHLLVVKYTWPSHKIKKVRVWLFVCPIAAGLAMAFAGIPFYGNIILWCNNAAKWWPEVPVIIAIVLATGIMASLCWHVFRTSRNSSKWAKRSGADRAFNRSSSGGGSGGSPRGGGGVATAVFWQSIWYLVPFYLTWSAYLTLQYLWASGEAYSVYGFVLFAAALVPLQGFWNAVVYFRLRMKEKGNEIWVSSRAMMRSLSATARSRSLRERLSLRPAVKSPESNPEETATGP